MNDFLKCDCVIMEMVMAGKRAVGLNKLLLPHACATNTVCRIQCSLEAYHWPENGFILMVRLVCTELGFVIPLTNFIHSVWYYMVKGKPEQIETGGKIIYELKKVTLYHLFSRITVLLTAFQISKLLLLSFAAYQSLRFIT